MKSFSSFLNESIAPASVTKVGPLAVAYLEKELATTVFYLHDAEQFKGSAGSGFGLRFFIPAGNRSLRLNWSTPNSIGMVGIKSADVWLDSTTPLHADFDTEASMVKVLPFIAGMLQGSIRVGKHFLAPNDVPLTEETQTGAHLLMENVDSGDAFDSILQIISTPGFTKGKIWQMYKGTGVKIFDEIQSRFPKLIIKSGLKFSWEGTTADSATIAKQKMYILSAIGAIGATITKGSSSETYSDKNVDQFESQVERLSFEQQLSDLENLVRLTIGGSSNALFVAGVGGVGKTHTVEEVLHSIGLRDGAGYFKNTGSASAAGVYSLLFAHRNGIILFDDSDDALKDQEARNIFKAATDTKKVRKLVWNKRGSNVVEPDGEMSDEEIIDEGLIPRWFEFTGRIIFISNLSIDKLDPDGAIRTRAYLIDISPTEAEIYERMRKIADKIPLPEGLQLAKADRLKCIELLEKGKSKQTANLRKAVRAMAMFASAKAGGSNVSDAEMSRLITFYA